jgi:hypothetical protein
MPREQRIENPGAIYVMSRANGNGSIFETAVDRQDIVWRSNWPMSCL